MSTWKTALVTGASVGIGESFARQLAAEGTDLVIVARDRKRLEALAKELRERHSVDVEVLRADLGKKAQLRTVEERLAASESPVDLLVNNAGFGTNGHFWELDVDVEEQEIALNVVALTRLTHAALARMVPAGRGAVLNVSSMASFSPSPVNSTYSATKAYVSSFSQGIHEDLRGTGVTITVVEPGFTRTEFQQRAGVSENAVPDFAWMTADDVAAEALDAVRKGHALCVPGRLNKVAAGATSVVPRSVIRRAVGAMSGRF